MQSSDWTKAMERGLTAAEVGERLRSISDDVDRSKRVLAFYLCEMKERRLHDASGHRDAAHFAATKRRLGWS